MNWLDSAIASISPEKALRRKQARIALAAYEAAKPTTLRKLSRDASSGNQWVRQAGNSLRNQARYLDANHDLARGVLNALVNNVVGANGIGIEPQPRSKSGEIHDDVADNLLRLWKDWARKPECTFTTNWAGAQRLLARSWFRDGEVFTKSLLGNVPYLDHGTKVKFTFEMLEADMLPLIFDDYQQGISQGIQRNGWGKATNYHFYKNHPGDINVFNSTSLSTSQVSADYVNHLRLRDRISQVRGVSVFASVMTRLDDIKDYEESERIAAKIAACMTAYIKKGAPDLFDDRSSDADQRSLKMQPGMIFDDLLVGEDIGTIDTNRPNTNLVSFRDGQIRMISSGTGANASTISKNYNGSYSSQRQELVEGYSNYQVLTNEFICGLVQPVWETFVKMVVAQNLIKIPKDVDLLTLDDALYIGPAMPWIDPLKEIKANVEGVRSLQISDTEVIRRRGANPRDVLEQAVRFRRQCKEKGLVSTSNPENDIQKTMATQ